MEVAVPGTGVAVSVGEAVGVRVGVTVGVLVGVPLGRPVGVFVGVFVAVLVRVFVGVVVGVLVGVLVGVFVGVLVGVLVGAGSTKHAENSDVSSGWVGGMTPEGLARRGSELLNPDATSRVAVDVMAWPAVPMGNVTLKDPLQVPSVGTVVAPRKVLPSPKPDGSQAGLAKNSTRNDELALLFNVPWMLVVPTPVVTEVMTG